MTSQLNETSQVCVRATKTADSFHSKCANSVIEKSEDFDEVFQENIQSLDRHKISANCLCQRSDRLENEFSEENTSLKVEDNFALEELLPKKSPPKYSRNRRKKRPRIRLKIRKNMMTSFVNKNNSTRALRESTSFDVQSSFSSCLAQIISQNEKTTKRYTVSLSL